MVKTYIARTKQIYPFGGSPSFFDRQDERRAELTPLPSPAVLNSPAYQALQQLCKEKDEEIVSLKLRLQRYEKAKKLPRAKKPKSSRKPTSDGPTRGRQAAADIIERDGVKWLKYDYIARLKGFKGAWNVGRQVEKRGLKRARFEDGVWRIPAAQAENIERKGASSH